MLEQLEEKIKELADKLEKSAANHNGLLGAMMALRELYQDAVAAKPVVEAVVKAAEDVAEEIEAVV